MMRMWMVKAMEKIIMMMTFNEEEDNDEDVDGDGVENAAQEISRRSYIQSAWKCEKSPDLGARSTIKECRKSGGIFWWVIPRQARCQHIITMQQ